MGRVAYINSGLALIPATSTSIQQLEEHSDKLAREFGVCRAERNEQWVKYLGREVPRRIKTLDGLIDVSVEMTEQAFEMSCSMRSEWGRCIFLQGKLDEEIIEANMIFAMKPQNVHSVPKVILLLGNMRVIVALPPKETPRQCAQCGEWTHKRENCAKRLRCFCCSSDKHEMSSHSCYEKECMESSVFCLYPPKCIVCGGPHEADHESCLLKPVYSKVKGAITKPKGAEVARIWGQLKAIRERTIRDNRLQNEAAKQGNQAESSQNHLNNISETTPPLDDF